MTSSRDLLLGSVRRALGRNAGEPSMSPDELEARLARHQHGLIPKRGQLGAREQMRLFIQMAREAAATTEEVRTLRAIPGAVASFLASHNLPAEIVAAPDPLLGQVRWETRNTLTVRHGAAEPADQASVTGAFAGVAETGTLVLASGADSPTTLNFLPDNHIVVLMVDRIVGSYEDMWDRLRQRGAERTGAWAMPRAVNFVTGPSRSADIEQTLLMGAHGPRRLHIILVRK